MAGWQDSFDRVTTTLHLPYGYRLLGAPGADRADGSWFSRWTLLDVFVAAIVALLAWRLFGITGAAIAIGYLVLAYQESGAPIWTLLATLALGLVAGLLPNGRLATAALWLRRAALALLVLFALPFVADQLRYALHPQLENEGAVVPMYADAFLGGAMNKEAPDSRAFRHRASGIEADRAPPAAAPAPPPQDIASSDQLETVTVAGSSGARRHREKRSLEEIRPHEQIQRIDDRAKPEPASPTGISARITSSAGAVPLCPRRTCGS